MSELPWIIETRDEAAGAGRTKYFTGKECKNGHFARRNVSSGACERCLTEYSSKYQKTRNATLIAKVTGGAVKLTVKVHPDDIAAVQVFEAQLSAARSALPPEVPE